MVEKSFSTVAEIKLTVNGVSYSTYLTNPILLADGDMLEVRYSVLIKELNIVLPYQWSRVKRNSQVARPQEVKGKVSD